MAFIDSHCHLDFDILHDQLEDVLFMALKKGVTQFIVPSVSVNNLEKVQALADQYSAIHMACGLHPCFMRDHKTGDVELLSEFVRHHSCIAIGEIGLDFFISTTDREREEQVLLFEQQLSLAKDLSLPVIVHARKAHDQILQSLKKVKFDNGGAIHAFNGSLQQADRYINEFGFKLGFGGALTYSGSKKIRRLAAELPLSSILLETDAPDMPLSEMGEGYNQPANIRKIAEVLCSLRNETAAQIEQQIEMNTMDCFRL